MIHGFKPGKHVKKLYYNDNQHLVKTFIGSPCQIQMTPMSHKLKIQNYNRYNHHGTIYPKH
jgi:hypothetical protein